MSISYLLSSFRIMMISLSTFSERRMFTRIFYF